MKLNTQRSLLCTTALIGFLVIPSHAYAEPQGGVVTGGAAGIQKSGNATTINQSSDRAIIRWDSFDLNSSESVRFNQPRASSITVNRIRDNKPSQIHGSISANGNIVLMNPNGVVFGATSTVDVGGLVATSSDLEDDNAFMNGGAVKFTKPGNADARIINHGKITVREGGLVGLVAPNVENHGIIEARLGKAVLASGDIATIDFAGDGLIKLQVSDGVLSQEVLNTGTIKADGGSIILTAAQARGMVDALITNTGTLQANTVKVGNVEQKGEILISTKGIELNLQMPRAEGIVFNTGTIEARGVEDTHNGGLITILGDTINIGDGSYVTASGGANGGTIKIGGEYQGGNGLPTSDKVFISEHVILNAESRRRGKGGTIILWSDDHTGYAGHADVSGGVLGGDAGFIEVSGKNTLAFTGTVDLTSAHGKRGTLLLDPTDIVISNGADQNINGTSPFTPSIDNGPTVLNISTLLAALASGDVIVQTRATGAQTGNITVSNAITWSSGSTLTLDAHNNIIVNAAISGNNLRFVVGNDLQLNAAVSGTGTLTIQQAADATTVGIGASAVGTLNLSTADLANITNGWGEIIIGKSTATAAMDIRATTWNDNLTLRSGSGTIVVNGIVNVGTNNLSITTNGDITINSGFALTGSGNLSISQGTAATTIGLGGGAGTINLSSVEIGRITNGWASITIGRTDGSGQINMGTVTWNDFLTVQSGSGLINVTGVQTMGANNLTFVTDGDIALGTTNILFGTGTLTFRQSSESTEIGLGDTQTGALNLTNLEVSRIRDGWASIVFGRTDSTGAINVGALSWTDALTLQTGSGVININGTQTMAANNLTLRSDADINLVGNLTGTGTLTLTQSSDNTSIAVGAGQTGTLNFTTADMARLTDGWTTVIFGRTDGSADLNVGAHTFVDGLTLLTGAGNININGILSISGASTMTTDTGALTIGAAVTTAGATTITTGTGQMSINANIATGTGALILRTDSNILINGDLSGSGAFALVQSTTGVSMGLGSSETGTVHLDDTELAHILNGWSGRTFGRIDSTATLNVQSLSWVDPLTLRTGSGILTVAGATMGANNLTLQSDSNIAINGSLMGSTVISILASNAATNIGVGDGQAGTLLISNAEFAQITNGWADIVIGSTTHNGDLNFGALTWNDRVKLRTGSGIMTFNGAQNFGGQTVNISTNSDIAINAQFTGTAALALATSSGSATIGVGTGQGGMINLSDAEVAFIADTFSSVTLGSTSQTGAITVGASTWKDPLTIRTRGIITTTGDINMAANGIAFVTASDIAIGAAINTTGAVTIAGSATNTTMGVGTGQVGTVNISDAELSFITNTTSSVIFGGTTMDVALNVGGRSWDYNTEFRTRSGAMNFNGVQNAGTKNITIRTGSNLTFTQNIVGSGTLNIMGIATTTTMGIGDAQTGILNLTNAELAFIADGWSNLIFGRTDSTVAINVGARTWTDSVDFRTLGAININGAQNMGANNLVLRSNANPLIGAALTGTGDLTFRIISGNTSVGIGDSMTGTVNFTDAELNFITNGWNLISFIGGGTGAFNVGARTWNDNVFFNNATGAMTLAAQTMGANNLSIRTSSGLAINGNLSGSGTLAIDQNATNTTLGVGTAGGGTLNISDAEFARIVDGWDNIVFGRTDSTVALTADNLTWNDNVTLQTGSGVLTVNGAVMGGNNLSLITNSNLTLGGNLTGTGNLVMRTVSGATVIAVGDGEVGTFALTNAELARLIDGWSSVTIGDASIVGNINIGAYTWVNPMSFVTGGNITINGDQVSTETSGNSLVFATINGAFINNAGSDALNAGGGRYLVYSVDEANDTLGGITRPGILTNQTYAGYGPGSVVEVGSQHIYSGVVSKILYLTIDDVDKIYGDTLPTFTYSYISGLVNGDLIGDVVASYSMNALGASTFDDAGVTRVITGNFTLNNGYSVVVTNGTMTVIKADLIVDADPTTRVYGDANPTFTVSYTGFKNGEDETDLDNLASAATSATILSDVGNYNIVTSGGSDSNYNYIYQTGTLTIGKSTLVATMQNTSRDYGDANPTFTASYTGFKNGQNASVIDTQVTGSSVGTGANVGTYAITGSGGLDNNYTFSFVNGTMTVNKATLLATANNASRAYGDANPTFGVTYTGFKNSETAAVIDTGVTISSLADNNSGVGTYNITTSGGLDNNYTFSYATGTLTVNKAVLTATAGNGTREYGDANPSFGVTYTGFKNGQNSSVIDTLATASSAANGTSGVGTYATVASGGIDDNYSFNYVDGTLTVTKAMLTATANNDTRVYGDANPTFGITYSGFKNGETSAVINTQATGSSVANNTSNVGTYAITAAGASDDNYNFTYANGTLTVTKAMLTATAGNASREYGDSNPAIGVTYTGFKNSETSAVINTLATASSAANATSNVGSYTTVASGGIDDNYDFTYVNGALTVTKAMLTATASNGTREYGDANPSFSVNYTGFKNGETSAVIDTAATASSAATATSNVGSYATIASGGVDTNYDFTYVNGALTVTKAMLTATAGNVSRAYGDANPAIGVTYTGFKNGETASVIGTAATASSAADNNSIVGSYSTVASGASDDNYNFTYVDGTLTVAKALLTATAGSASRAYGDANPALGVTYTGFKNGQTVAVIDTQATASSLADNLSNVGTYATTATGAIDDNYDFAYTDGVLTVNKAMLTATAANVSREYGDANGTIGVTYTGFKNGENDSVIGTLATGASAANISSNVGTYATTASGASDNNYDFSYVNGTLTVTKATLLATADDKTRIYGNGNPANTFTYTGFKNSETVAVINVGATGNSGTTTATDVGTYNIIGSGASDDNYDFIYANGTLTITKRMLTATAANVSRVYGDANPTINVTYTGFRSGDNASSIDTLATGSSSAGNSSNVGTYATTASGGFDNNYDFTYVDGVLTVGKATLTATANNISREYGDANGTIGVTYTGFKNGEDDSVIGTLATGASIANLTSNVGTYATTASGAFDDNYTFTYANGTLTVTKAMLLATADNKTRTYGASAPAYTFTYTGFKNFQDESVINVEATGATAATATSDVGTYAITGSGASDNNYDFTYADGTLTVTQATLTVRADDVSRDQGLANPAFTITYSGFRNGEDSSVLNTLATASTTANTGSAIGTYAITTSGAADNNYTFNYVDGTLTVLDPGYVPPPPAQTPTQLPSTVDGALNTPSAIQQNSMQYFMPAGQDQTLFNDPRLEHIIVVPSDEDFDYVWPQYQFLIAITDTVQNYYNLVSWQEDVRP